MPFVGGIIGAGVGAAVGAGFTGSSPVAPGASGQLRIEPDQLDAAIQIFQNALASVETEVMNARYTLSAEAPANDDVSVNAAHAFNRLGYENANSALAAWEGCVAQLRSVIEQLEAAKQANVNADTSNSAFLQNGS